METAGPGPIRAVELEITPPLETEIVDLVAANRRIPVRDKEPLVRSAGAVLGRAAVVHGR